MNSTATPASKRPRGSQAARKAVQRDKCTLLLDRDTSIKLGVAAHIRGIDRSDLVNELLAEALRYVVISLRGHSPSSASSTVDSSPASPETATAA
jgi:hypothetical protein